MEYWIATSIIISLAAVGVTLLKREKKTIQYKPDTKTQEEIKLIKKEQGVQFKEIQKNANDIKKIYKVVNVKK